MSKSKEKGTDFETQCVEYLRRRLEDDRIERRALHGAKDMGDIFGLHAHGYEGIVECKSYKSYGDAHIEKWRERTVDERGNADADFALLVVHRPGCGRMRFGRNWCHMQVRDLEKIADRVAPRHPDDPFLDTWVITTVDQACDFIMYETKGKPWQR